MAQWKSTPYVGDLGMIPGIAKLDKIIGELRQFNWLTYRSGMWNEIWEHPALLGVELGAPQHWVALCRPLPSSTEPLAGPKSPWPTWPAEHTWVAHSEE